MDDATLVTTNFSTSTRAKFLQFSLFLFCALAVPTKAARTFSQPEFLGYFCEIIHGRERKERSRMPRALATAGEASSFQHGAIRVSCHSYRLPRQRTEGQRGRGGCVERQECPRGCLCMRPRKLYRVIIIVTEPKTVARPASKDRQG